MDIVKNYWNEQWVKRVENYVANVNWQKFGFLFGKLIGETRFADMEKLDVGCGIGLHALMIRQAFSGWQKKWTGIDVSEYAVEFAKRHGLNAICMDAGSFYSDKKFELYLFMDSFEHLMNEESVIEMVKRTSAQAFYVFGNVPLYTGHHAHDGGVEKQVGLPKVIEFMRKCGVEYMTHEIYGIAGCPYMLFEGGRDA